jgi:transcriptional regulator with PAS, ATPase and Fis domain
VGGGTSSTDIEPFNAWQILRNCAASRDGDIRGIFNSLAQNLAEASGVRRVTIHLQPGLLDTKAQWFKGGSTHGKSGVSLPEERLLQVAQTGVGIGGRAGAAKPLLPEQTYDTLCLPVRVRGDSRGFLYAEAEDFFARETIGLMTGAAEAVGVATGLWMMARNERPPAGAAASPGVSIIGCSTALQSVMRLAVRAAESDSTVLIRGESGTGKELFARLIYTESKRAAQTFLCVHCSAIEETLMGSTLFGYEKGAFTGAVGMKKGLFEEANNGTIFLDEIGELTPSMQVRLLRVLQEGEFMRIGGTKVIKVDVRIIAATNRDLEKAVRDGLFREDLYFRLKVIELRLPSLRERREDIPELVNHFVADLTHTTASRVREILPETMEVLKQYPWPGNVRELRNVIERCLVLAEGPSLQVDDLPADIVVACPPPPEPASSGATHASVPDLEAAEQRHIRRVLQQCDGNKRLAAQQLGISRSTLYEKLK